ncbi:MAG: fatty acid desaturase [Planctomycetota bacterium]|nr:fatty acid desaturase [Planctomycetota bacterium]
MREPKELILASKPYASEHRWLSWWHLLSTLGIFGGLVVLSCTTLPLGLRIVTSVVAGLVLVRLFILYHDFQHGTILRGSRTARAIMFGYGMLALNPPSIWNRSHNHHHKNNAKIFGADIGSYPMMTTEAYAAASTKERFLYSLARHPLTIACGYVTIFLYGMCTRSLFINPRKHYDSAISLVAHLSLAIWLGSIAWDWLVLGLIVPCVIASALGSYLFYCQHNYPDVKLRDSSEWNYVYAALHSSSYIKMSRLMHWFSGNIGYHHVHHLNAHIPFYRLPEAMAGIEELQSPGTTSLRPRDVLACLRLKVWDVELDRLVSYSTATTRARSADTTGGGTNDQLAKPHSPTSRSRHQQPQP